MSDQPTRQWRHAKRVTVYEEVGCAELRISAVANAWDGAALMIYRSRDGKLWARPKAEFHDGRFEEMSHARLPD